MKNWKKARLEVSEVSFAVRNFNLQVRQMLCHSRKQFAPELLVIPITQECYFNVFKTTKLSFPRLAAAALAGDC